MSQETPVKDTSKAFAIRAGLVGVAAIIGYVVNNAADPGLGLSDSEVGMIVALGGAVLQIIHARLGTKKGSAK